MAAYGCGLYAINKGIDQRVTLACDFAPTRCEKDHVCGTKGWHAFQTWQQYCCIAITHSTLAIISAGGQGAGKSGCRRAGKCLQFHVHMADLSSDASACVCITAMPAAYLSPASNKALSNQD